jgi:hypothetical protein
MAENSEGQFDAVLYPSESHTFYNFTGFYANTTNQAFNLAPRKSFNNSIFTPQGESENSFTAML